MSFSIPFKSLFFGEDDFGLAADESGDDGDFPLFTGESGGVAGLFPAGEIDEERAGDVDEAGIGGEESAGDDVDLVFGVIG